MVLNISHEQKVINAKEYSSLLLSCQLAVWFNKDKPNKALRHTLKKVRKRITSPYVKAICSQGLKEPFPQGWLSRQLHNIERIGKTTPEKLLGHASTL